VPTHHTDLRAQNRAATHRRQRRRNSPEPLRRAATRLSSRDRKNITLDFYRAGSSYSALQVRDFCIGLERKAADTQRKIAVIGSGLSGLCVAYVQRQIQLSAKCRVSLC